MSYITAMTKALYIFAFALFFGGLLYHFAALKIFNFLVPKDGASEQIAQSVAYGSDPQQKLDIYRPTRAGLYPVLVFVHGGSWKDGSGSDYEFVGRAFAAQGFLTLVISYRLLPQNAYPDFVIDAAEAIAWANKHATEYGGDGQRIFVVGHSAGAYNISLAILDSHYLRDAGLYPNVIRGVATLAGPFDFVPLDSPITIATFGHLKDLAPTQPINYVSADAPPFLLLHGTADSTVKPRNSRSLFKHLTDVGAHPKLIEYQDVSHVGIMLSLAKPLRDKAPVLDDVVNFFRDTSR
jgi:acetyl esterase/lipase